MTTNDYETNLIRLESFRNQHNFHKAMIIAAQNDLKVWEQNHLAELKKCEELNSKFEAMERA